MKYYLANNLMDRLSDIWAHDLSRLVHWYYEEKKTKYLYIKAVESSNVGFDTLTFDYDIPAHEDLITVANFLYLKEKYGEIFPYLVNTSVDYMRITLTNVELPDHLVPVANAFFIELFDCFDSDVMILDANRYSTFKQSVEKVLIKRDGKRLIDILSRLTPNDPELAEKLENTIRRLKRMDLVPLLCECLDNTMKLWEDTPDFEENLRDRYSIQSKCTIADLLTILNWVNVDDSECNVVLDWFSITYPEPIDESQLALF